MSNQEQSQDQSIIKEDEKSDSTTNETSKFNKDSKMNDSKLKLIIESNPAIEQSISKIKEEVEELFFNPKKEVASNKATAKSDAEKPKPLENLNNLLADEKVRAMVNMVVGKEAHGILVDTLKETNSSKSIQERQNAIINGVRKFQSLNKDSIIDISKHLFGSAKPYKK